jgi:hypothetical protein
MRGPRPTVALCVVPACVPHGLVDAAAAVARERIMQAANEVIAVVLCHAHEGTPHDNVLDLNSDKAKYTHIHTYIHTYTHTRTHTHTHTHTHTYIHAYVHTYTQTDRQTQADAS